MIKLVSNNASSTSAFQWSTSEQVYPLEKSNSGETLYCREFNIGALPDNGQSFTSIGSIVPEKIIAIYGRGVGAAIGYALPLGFSGCNASAVALQIYGGNIVITTTAVWSSVNSCFVRVIYSK